MSQTDAQAHREQIRADLRDELVTHDQTRCDYCSTGAACLDLHYAQLAAEMVEARLNRPPRGAGGDAAAHAERIARAVREALEQLAARQKRPNPLRRPDTRGWPELQNDARSTL